MAGNFCQALPAPVNISTVAMMTLFSLNLALYQGLTLVHCSAQLQSFLWDRGCVWELFRGCLGGLREYRGLFRGHFVSERLKLS